VSRGTTSLAASCVGGRPLHFGCVGPDPSGSTGAAAGSPYPFFPQILGRGAAVFSLDASHTVPIGQYVESVEEGP
jgi:hypothetical protein